MLYVPAGGRCSSYFDCRIRSSAAVRRKTKSSLLLWFTESFQHISSSRPGCFWRCLQQAQPGLHPRLCGVSVRHHRVWAGRQDVFYCCHHGHAVQPPHRAGWSHAGPGSDDLSLRFVFPPLHPAVDSSLPVTKQLLLLVSQSCLATPPQLSLGSTPTTYPRLCLPFLVCACWERDWRWVQMKARKSWRRCRQRSRRRMKK